MMGMEQPSMTTMPQMEVEAPMTDGSWPGVIAMPQEEMARSELLVAQVMMFEARLTEGDMARVYLEFMLME
jgi:hypothetical protein